MNITINPQTQKLLEERMQTGDYSSPDELIRVALESLSRDAVEVLDVKTQAAIRSAESQADWGKEIPIDEAFARLRDKHFGA